MTAASPVARKCPVCRTREGEAAYKPFCSKRCADIDLSRWLNGAYVIPGPPADLEEDDAPPVPRDREE